MKQLNNLNTTRSQLERLKGLFVKPEGSRKGLNKARIMVFSTLLLIGVGLVYFHFYSEAEGRKFDQRRFRVLWTLEQNIKRKEIGYFAEFKKLKEAYLKNPTREALEDIKNKDLKYMLVPGSTKKTNIPEYYHFGNLEPKDTIKALAGDGTLGIFIEIGSYLDDLIPKKTFDNLIILEVENNKPRIKFQNLSNKVLLSDTGIKDLLKKSAQGFYTGSVHDTVSYLGETYRMYVHISGQFDVNERFIDQDLFQSELNDKQEIILGLVKESTFLASSRQVSIWWVILLSILAVVTIVSLPLLKIVFMNDLERLKSADVVLTGMSVIVGAPFILLIILSLTDYAGYYNYEQKNDLRKFGTEIDNTFTNEINLVLKQLYQFRLDDIDIDTDQCAKGTTTRLKPDQLSQYQHYNHFNEFFGMDSEGCQTFSLTTYSKEKELLDLSNRRYFRDLKEDRTWTTELNLESGKFTQEFSLQSVTSWTTGDHELVVGRALNQPISNTTMLAMSTRPASVIQPVIRPGYGFAIIDESGHTLFNSNTSRMNSENFIEEVNFNKELTSAIFGKREAYMQVNYWGDRVMCRVQPSKKFPVFIVTYYKMQLARSFISEIASMCVAYIVAAFLMVGVLVYISAVTINKSRPLFKFKEFVFEWLRPVKSTDTYRVSLAYMSFVGVLYIVLFLIIFPSDEVWKWASNIVAISLLLPSMIYVSNYWINKFINRHHLKLQAYQGRSRGWMILYFLMHLGIITIYVLILTHYMDSTTYFIIMSLLWCCSTCIVLWMIWKWPGLEVKIRPWRTKIKVVVKSINSFFAKIISRFQTQTKRGDESGNDRSRPMSYYYCYMFMWLFFTALLPLYFMFHLAKDMEEMIYSKYEMLQIARAFDQKTDLIYDEFKTIDDDVSYKKDVINSKLFDFQFQESKSSIQSQSTASNQASDSCQIDKKVETGDVYLDRISMRIMPQKKKISDQNIITPWEKLLFYIRPRFNESVSDGHSLIASQLENFKWTFEEDSEQNSTLNLFYNVERGTQGLQAINLVNPLRGDDSLGLSPGMSFYYYGFVFLAIVLFLRLTFLVIRQLSWFIFSLDYKEIAQVYNLESDFKINLGLFIICPSFRSKMKVIKELGLPHLDLDKFVQHLISIEDTRDRTKFIRKVFNEKLKLLVASNYPSVLVSTFKDENNQSPPERDLLLGYISMYQQQIVPETEPDVDFANDGLERDVQEWRDQKVHYHYYKNVWEASSTRERYIMYDLAQDGFANTKNSTSVLYLLNKGLLKWNGQLRLFSEGFRTFILTVIKPKEGRQLESEIASRGSWQIIQYLLYGLIAAVLVFISFGEPDFFQDFNTVLTLIASVVTLFPVIGSLFSVK